MADEFDNMSPAELNSVLKRQVVNMDILMRDVKDIKFTLIGNEMNNNTGLVKDFADFKHEIKEYQKECDERIEKVEHYQTGMKWGTRILGFIIASGVFIQFMSGIKWIIKQIIE